MSDSRDESSGRRLYYCHGCNRQLTHLTPEFSCPQCQSGFVEELGEESINDMDEDLEDIEYPPPMSLNEVLNSVFPMNTGMPTGASRQGPRIRISGGPAAAAFGGPAPAAFGGSAAAAGNIFGQNNPSPFFNDLLANLMGMEAPGGMAQGGPPHIHFVPAQLHGNPGDYAWGHGGLDAIVTNLLNQMDGAGPPPLAKEAINDIPKVKVEQEQVDKKVHCSVCWEDFKLDEEVRKLNCEHIYHEACILPWLELHGTCPVCRKSQDNEDQTGTTPIETPGSPTNVGTTEVNPSTNSFNNTISTVISSLFGFPTAQTSQSTSTTATVTTTRPFASSSAPVTTTRPSTASSATATTTRPSAAPLATASDRQNATATSTHTEHRNRDDNEFVEDLDLE